MNETPSLIANLVEPYLKDFNWKGITLSLDQGDIYERDSYWRVPVRPSRWPDRLFPVFEELAIIEEHLQDDHHLKAIVSLGEPVNEETELAVAPTRLA